MINSIIREILKFHLYVESKKQNEQTKTTEKTHRDQGGVETDG